MNKCKMLVAALLFIILPNVIYASCTKEDIDYYKMIKDEFKVTYEYDKDAKDNIISFYNPDPEKFAYNYVFTVDSKMDYEEKDNVSILSVHGYMPGEYEYKIVGNHDECYDTFKTSTIKIAKYNTYHDDPLCKGIEEFVLCQPTYDKEIDYDTFVSRVNTYKKTKPVKSEEEKNDNNQNELVNKVWQYISKYMLQIVGAITLLIGIIVTIILTAKSIKKSRRLE